jgi:hypothetical protein
VLAGQARQAGPAGQPGDAVGGVFAAHRFVLP